MTNNGKSGLGEEILVFGSILLVIGLILSLYEKVEIVPIEMLWGWENVPISRGYPYRFIGIPLALVGTIVALYGGIRTIIDSSRKTGLTRKEISKSNNEVEKEKTEVSSETIQSGYFCRYCGFKNQKHAIFCNQCGKRIS